MIQYPDQMQRAVSLPDGVLRFQEDATTDQQSWRSST